jgi:hypothetical protein
MNNHPSKPPQRGGLNVGAVKRSIPFFIAFLSLLAGFLYNELNIQALKQEAPERLEPKYNWVKTADDISYLRPAENYYQKGIWRDNNPGRQSYFLRTPGYGFFRYSLMVLFGQEQSYFYFKYVQLLLFGISVLLLFYIALLIGLPLPYALLLEGLYGLTPFASGFIYYSISEGITPALMIGYTYFLLAGYKRNKASYFLLAALLLAYIGLTRPLLLLFGAALPLAIYWSGLSLSFSRKMLFTFLNCFIALAPLGMWALRSANIAGEYVGIYPIYYAENNSQFRPTHQAIWEFERSYGTEGKDFHQFMVPLWAATARGDSSDLALDSILIETPAFVKQSIGEQRLRRSYDLYRQSIVYQRDHYPRGTAMPDTIPAIERLVITDFETYTREINSKHWLWCHIVVPVKLFKSLSFHSNLSLYMFQHTYRGHWWMEAARLLFLILHLLCCLSFIGVFFLKGDKLYKVYFGLIVVIYFFYLCYYFRGLEERYTLPILPLMLASLIYNIYVLLKRNVLVQQSTENKFFTNKQ